MATHYVAYCTTCENQVSTSTEEAEALNDADWHVDGATGHVVTITTVVS